MTFRNAWTVRCLQNDFQRVHERRSWKFVQHGRHCGRTPESAVTARSGPPPALVGPSRRGPAPAGLPDGGVRPCCLSDVPSVVTALTGGRRPPGSPARSPGVFALSLNNGSRPPRYPRSSPCLLPISTNNFHFTSDVVEETVEMKSALPPAPAACTSFQPWAASPATAGDVVPVETQHVPLRPGCHPLSAS